VFGFDAFLNRNELESLRRTKKLVDIGVRTRGK
jgi:hypothetical protein